MRISDAKLAELEAAWSAYQDALGSGSAIEKARGRYEGLLWHVAPDLLADLREASNRGNAVHVRCEGCVDLGRNEERMRADKAEAERDEAQLIATRLNAKLGDEQAERDRYREALDLLRLRGGLGKEWADFIDQTLKAKP